jgi:hypothetical protein
MEQLIDHKLKRKSQKKKIAPKQNYKKCDECNRKRKNFDKVHKICHICYKARTIFISSENKLIDDFIKYTLINNYDKRNGKMEFVPYDRFVNIELIAEGGFGKIYKAIWTDGPISKWIVLLKW